MITFLIIKNLEAAKDRNCYEILLGKKKTHLTNTFHFTSFFKKKSLPSNSFEILINAEKCLSLQPRNKNPSGILR
ncbi:hypothetical protein A9P82_03875 [Arachidicoccus ginsenosidimutans]|nr:hypothetical protein A9P82_03875 [Arachidicoccus sp. BS20]